MASKTEICNLAIGHLGVGKAIQNIETDTSAEANACRTFFEMSVEATLRDFSWPFARKFKALGLVEESPTTEWGYSYRYPSDCLSVRRILSGVRNDSSDSLVPYILAQDDTGILIMTDMGSAVIEYTARTENSMLYPADFVVALSYRLASFIAPKITGGDAFRIGERALAFYNLEIGKAGASASNEERKDNMPDTDLVRARG